MQIIATIENSNIYRDPISDIVRFVGDCDVDCDGSGGNPDHDPYYQDDTTYHHEGKALNAYKVRFVVVPSVVIRKTKGIVLGCRCILTNLMNRQQCETVVGDIGPYFKTGEASPAACAAVGLQPNPNWGGTDTELIYYEVFPGIPAVLDGVTYTLQPHHG